MDSKSVQSGATPGPSATKKQIFVQQPILKKNFKNMVTVEKKKAPPKKRFYRKRVKLFNLVNQIKLWPSRKGYLHGIKNIEIQGNKAKLTTHCHKEFFISNSLNCRAARWLRNKWYTGVCKDCRVPDWKLDKYSSTLFRRHQGSLLTIKDK